MDEQEACTGGAGAVASLDLQLRTVMGRQRRSREHRTQADDCGDVRPHLRTAGRAKGRAAMPGETGGNIISAGGWRIRDAGAQSGERCGAGEVERRAGLGPLDAAGLGGAAVGAGVTAEFSEAQTCSASQGGTHRYRKKTGTWTNLSLENALNSITDDGMSIREASK